MKKQIIIAFLVLFIIGCSNQSSITLKTASKDYVFNVDISDNSIERIKGLMFRKQLPKENGMLFFYEDEEHRSFWMKNTLIPLDIIFIDSKLKIVEIKEGIMPCKEETCKTYNSIKPAQYVLEINGGLSEEMGLSIGDSIEIPFKR